MPFRRAPQHAPLVYHRAALTHVAQVAPAAIAALTALFTFSVLFAVVALVTAEALLLVAIPRTTTFRADVDRRIETAARVASAEERTRLLSMMSPAHVTELLQLERLALRIRERSVERYFEIEPFLARYVRLSIAHRRSTEMFSAERWSALEARFAELRCGTAAADDLWIARRESVLTIRRATWLRAREDRHRMEHALATIADVVRWVDELAAVPIDDPGHAALDTVLKSCAMALADVRRLESDVPVDFELRTDVDELPSSMIVRNEVARALPQDVNALMPAPWRVG